MKGRKRAIRFGCLLLLGLLGLCSCSSPSSNFRQEQQEDKKESQGLIYQDSENLQYAENFSNKIKSAIKALDPFAEGYEKTGYNIEGLEIYYKPYSTYLIFFVVEDATVTVIRVLKDRMYWQAILRKMNKINR